MIEVTIESIIINPINSQRAVLLKEKAAERYLPIWVGPAEANAIIINIQGVNVPRPMSHDLIQSVISTLNASIDFIVISEIRDEILYGKIILSVPEGKIEIDSRPSDALALAVRARAPIYTEDAVLDEAGIFIDSETGKAVPEGTTGGTSISEAELKKLSVYNDFISTLNTEDLGRGPQER